MIERIDGMPAGTVGWRASDKLLTDFGGLEAAAIPEDIKTGLKTWVAG